MFLPPALLSLLSLLLTTPLTHAATPSPTPKPCTIHSPSTGSFFDLRPLQILPPSDPSASSADNTSYHVRGWDYPSNFTLNICGPIIENLSSVAGIPSSRLHNISAFYRDETDTIYSIGQSNNIPIFRGKKLLLNYTNGSPCPELDEDGHPIPDDALTRRKIIDDDDDDDDSSDDEKPPRRKPTSKSRSTTRHKTTLLSLHCDTSPLLTTKPSISFLGTPDHCTYIFEIRSRYACAGATPATDPGSLGPGGVFGVIFGIAFLVYLIGGCVYQRSVMHQRGWRQLPNYSVWAGLAGFVGDTFIILFSTCIQHMPSMTRLFGGRGAAGGYHRVGAEDRAAGRGRGRTPDDENRLIDELDEEWDN